MRRSTPRCVDNDNDDNNNSNNRDNNNNNINMVDEIVDDADDDGVTIESLLRVMNDDQARRDRRSCSIPTFNMFVFRCFRFRFVCLRSLATSDHAGVRSARLHADFGVTENQQNECV